MVVAPRPVRRDVRRGCLLRSLRSRAHRSAAGSWTRPVTLTGHRSDGSNEEARPPLRRTALSGCRNSVLGYGKCPPPSCAGETLEVPKIREPVGQSARREPSRRQVRDSRCKAAKPQSTRSGTAMPRGVHAEVLAQGTVRWSAQAYRPSVPSRHWLSRGSAGPKKRPRDG